MGHSHSHEHVDASPEAAATRRRANRLLAAILIPITLVTILGMFLLWPSGTPTDVEIGNPYSAAQGASFQVGTVERTSLAPCLYPSTEASVDQECATVHLAPDSGGATVAVEVPPEVDREADVKVGDRIRYLDLGAAGEGAQSRYSFMDFVRTVPMALLAAVYAFVVVLVARWRGLRALLGLAGAYAVVAHFIIPGLVQGAPPILLGLVGSSVIMIGVLYFAHGFSARTSTALLGTIFGLVTTSLIAAWATGAAHLTGLNDEADYTLSYATGSISLSGILVCGLIISGLGVLNDVTITQSSAVWEMHELAPESSARRLFAGAMRVGRDHIASTVYTIVFAYAGAALPLLILLSLQERPFVETISSGELAEEIVRTLVGSIGLVLAIPVTTGIAVLVVKAVGTKGGSASTALREPVDATTEPTGSRARPTADFPVADVPITSRVLRREPAVESGTARGPAGWGDDD
ncbi:YibE/F family protein [Mycetocola miduiensis]|uniref:YibE/F-like protein n=1 Tax=Mycetocola miduiensis TaxID=995034 RepID=A0A1I4YX22_9MICO|nr:YibE/F family protein [Mycetocola miduiensis]SFN42552.1 YibE/F-like protein [Mycetocola miduiensis]